MKKNIEFYPHYASADQHAKFKMLRVQFGWGGEGKFWALNNRIACSEECCLDVGKKYNRAAIANDLDFTLEELAKFLIFLKDDCELIQECGEGVITTEIIQETFAKVMHERGQARTRYGKTSGEEVETSGEEVETSGEEVETSGETQARHRRSFIHSKVKERRVKDKVFLSDSIEVRLSELLFSKMLLNNPKAKKPNFQTWAKNIDLMIRIDERTPDEIRSMIEWSQQDVFWHTNILSTTKLRSQYDQIILKMQPTTQQPKTAWDVAIGEAI